MSLTISVITPSFRQGHFIQRTIDSVLSQGLAPDEFDYVICDGGSDDETVDILKRYGDRLRWVSEPDNGQADAVNKGIAMTSGDIIAWINSDDVYYPNAFKTVQKIFRENPDIQVIYGDADHIDENDAFIEPYPTEYWNYNRLFQTCFLCQPAVFFRRSIVDKLGFLNGSLNYCMDYELWLRYGKVSSFYYHPEKLAGSRLYETNKTLGQRLNVYFEINNMIFEKLGHSIEKWVVGYSQLYLTDELKLKTDTALEKSSFLFLLNTHIIRNAIRWKTWFSLPTILLLGRHFISSLLYRLKLHPKLTSNT